MEIWKLTSLVLNVDLTDNKFPGWPVTRTSYLQYLEFLNQLLQ